MQRSGEELRAALAAERYFIDAATAGRILHGLRIGRPLLVSGPRGCGKDSLAVALAAALGSPLARLDCGQGMGARSAAYRWDTAQQLEAIEAANAAGRDPASVEREITSDAFLIKGPLLEAITGEAATLLVAGLERADPGLLRLLATFLGDYSIDVPQLGRFEAAQPPLVLITCVHEDAAGEAIARQCSRVPLAYPSFEDEAAAIHAAVPAAGPGLAAQVVNVVQRLRREGLEQPPGVGESIAWTRRLAGLGQSELDHEAIVATADALLPLRADRERAGRIILEMARPRLDRAG